MDNNSDISLIDGLRHKDEAACVEFKKNWMCAKDVGKYISALANAAALAEESCGYLVWGIRDSDHAVVGTDFDPTQKKEGNQSLIMWLTQRINPDSNFEFRPIAHPEGQLVLLKVPAATTNPISFENISYIRINSSTSPLHKYPERERALWDALRATSWENHIAAKSVSPKDVMRLIDYPGYFDLMGLPLPENQDGILERLKQDEVIAPDSGGMWNVTNLGAILFAKSLDAFGSHIARKGVRFIAYAGKGAYDQVTHRRDALRGYAVGFNDFVSYVNGISPAPEQIGPAFRTAQPMFPELAVRELVANALIHQDMTVRGAGPLVQLFHNDRIEIGNPGKLLAEPHRLIDTPPRSRNEKLAARMRRTGICEEAGTGIDKVVRAVEEAQSPPPDFETAGNATKATLYAWREFSDMTTEERVRACYQHTALLHQRKERMKNSTLRKRFGLPDRSRPKVSQVIRAALEANLIKLADTSQPKTGYRPFWA